MSFMRSLATALDQNFCEAGLRPCFNPLLFTNPSLWSVDMVPETVPTDKRKDAGKSRAKITNLRIVGDESPARQIKYNGKWHVLQEVNINIVLSLTLILFVGERLVCLSLV